MADRTIRLARTACLAVVLAALAACGGTASEPPADPPATKAESARFLGQATFGASDAWIEGHMSLGYTAWFEENFARRDINHLRWYDSIAVNLPADQSAGANQIYESFWRAAMAGDDQFRHRIAFALSQIFVVSLVDDNVAQEPRGVASWFDMLADNAFGNFRNLIEQVALHPVMGIYLSHLRNQKEDPARGRVPDENFAREVMQLFTIGLYELNADGTVKLDSRNEPIETYGNADVSGLAKVFTGWSWSGPDTSDQRFFGNMADPDRAIRPMQGYAKFHSTSEKRFLGTVIPAGGSADPRADLKIALDALFNHPNVGPFIGKQLIQRLVTSNPSPAYVARVSAAFANNGQGVRGDMRTVIKAVLMDAEARTVPDAADTRAGRLREPVLRLAAWGRAFGARSTTDRFQVGSTDDPNGSLGQTPLRSPSVFNFYRPGYVPPGSALATGGMVAPEMQITNETSVSGYLNFMRSVVANGVGNGSPRDVLPGYNVELTLAPDPAALVERVAMLLTGGTMSAATRAQIVAAVASVPMPASGSLDTALRNRVQLAVFLTLASPDFLVQK